MKDEEIFGQKRGPKPKDNNQLKSTISQVLLRDTSHKKKWENN